MFSRAATRTTTTLVSRRAFHATRARMSSPYHYPDGAYTNLPFNPHSKWFSFGYWTFMATGFFAPFGIAGTTTLAREISKSEMLGSLRANGDDSLPNIQVRPLDDSFNSTNWFDVSGVLQWRAARGYKVTDNVVIQEVRIDFLAVTYPDCNIIPFVDIIVDSFLQV